MSMSKQHESISKFLSLVLRHQPEAIGLKLDAEGFANVSELIAKSAANKQSLTLDLLREVVSTSDKKRFAFSSDGLKIRANQGHSISVDLALAAKTPPDVLYHGTATRFIDSIKREGLIPGSRQHVHLSLDIETALKVGARHGKPIILSIATKQMFDTGHAFFLSDNGVWLTDAVPARFLGFDSVE
jgi:putative RNA 2'-phosphotransferase